MKLLSIILCAFVISSYASAYSLENSAEDTQGKVVIGQGNLAFQGPATPAESKAEEAEVTTTVEPKPEEAAPTYSVEVTTVANEETLFGEPIQEQVIVAEETKPDVAPVLEEETLFSATVEPQVVEPEVAVEPKPEEVAAPVEVTAVPNEETLFGEPIQEEVTSEVVEEKPQREVTAANEETLFGEPIEEVTSEVVEEKPQPEEVVAPVEVTAANEETLFGEPIQEEVTAEVVEEKPQPEEVATVEQATEVLDVYEAAPEAPETKPEIVYEEEPEIPETKPEIVYEEVPEVIYEEPEVLYTEPEIIEDVYETSDTYETTAEIPESEPVGVPGGKTDVDLTTIADDKDIQAILDLGVSTLLKTTSEEGNLPASETPFRITRINRIQQQVVSGINYFCDVVLQNDADLRIYATFTVFSQPWTSTLKVTDGCVKIGRMVKY